MKVIHSIKENYPKRVMCDGCFAELEYTKDDIYVGPYGCAYIKCPVCQNELILENETEDIPELTVDTVLWPQHFMLPRDKAADIGDAEIQKWIDECLQSLNKQSEDESYSNFAFRSSGDTMVFAFKLEDEYAVYVTKSYADTVIPR